MRWRELFFGILGGLVGGLLVNISFTRIKGIGESSQQLKTVTAEQFILMDSKGGKRGSWYVSSDTTQLDLKSPDGSNFSFLIGPGKGGLVYSDGQGHAPMILSYKKELGPAFVLSNAETGAGVSMGSTKDTPIISLNDAKGMSRLSVSLAKTMNEIALLCFISPEGQVKARIGGDPKKGESVISLWNKEGKAVPLH